MTEALATGRIVWGHPTKAKQKLHMDGAQKGQPVIGKDGQPVMERSFGLAIPKLVTLQNLQAQGQNVDLSTAFEQAIWPQMAAEIFTGYPNGAPSRFSYKYHDGDGMDHEGKPFAEREGYAGHIVLTISTVAGAPGLWKLNPQSGQYEQLTEDQIKCGDYVRVGISFKVNVATGTNTPSIYVNPQAVEFLGYGKEISNGPNPAQLFGGRAAALPPGASATPVGGAAGQMPPGMGGMPGQQPMQGGMPGQQPMQGGMPGQQPMQGGMPGQQPMQGGMPGQQPMQGGMPGQQPMQGGMPGQQPMQGGMPGQQPMQGGMPGQQPMQGGMPGQQPMQGGMPGQQPMQGGMPGYGQPGQQMPPPAHDFVQNAGQPSGMPGMPGQQPMQGGMPGMMPPR